ncbi:MAG: hypothetical protein O2909_07770 [Chloroflexi bacterium]|nr:hypothetical protein [Chloroflexota bacterium]MDA1219325.1 hypothetical protein [Chloroflexota bacterium]PKB57451.1 MAG: hypothetical protein BZY73_03080 [SAR202 cluster bacterium Casp-Chloro-G3]
MTQELGRVERPSADQYQGKRKLLLVPLLYGPQANDEEGSAIVAKYWGEVRIQTGALEASLGALSHVYCESLVQGGAEGLSYLELADKHSHELVQAKCQAGAVLEPTEDQETFMEMVDLQRFMVQPLASQKVANRLQEWFTECDHARYEHIGSRIDATLQLNETGLILIGERHQVQFPSDIEVFYVSPPALDEFRRWLQNWVKRQREQPAPGDASGETEGETVNSD